MLLLLSASCPSLSRSFRICCSVLKHFWRGARNGGKATFNGPARTVQSSLADRESFRPSNVRTFRLARHPVQSIPMMFEERFKFDGPHDPDDYWKGATT